MFDINNYYTYPGTLEREINEITRQILFHINKNEDYITSFSQLEKNNTITFHAKTKELLFESELSLKPKVLDIPTNDTNAVSNILNSVVLMYQTGYKLEHEKDYIITNLTDHRKAELFDALVSTLETRADGFHDTIAMLLQSGMTDEELKVYKYDSADINIALQHIEQQKIESEPSYDEFLPDIPEEEHEYDEDFEYDLT